MVDARDNLVVDGLVHVLVCAHAEVAIGELGSKGAKGVVTLGANETGTTKEDHATKLDDFRTCKYTAIAARLNYLTSDRPDIAFSFKGLARSMSSPTSGCQDKVRRLGGYLITKPRAVMEFKLQEAQNEFRILQTLFGLDAKPPGNLHPGVR